MLEPATDRVSILARLAILCLAGVVVSVGLSFAGDLAGLLSADGGLDQRAALYLLVTSPLVLLALVGLARNLGLWHPPASRPASWGRAVKIGVLGWLVAAAGSVALELLLERFRAPFQEQGFVQSLIEAPSPLVMAITFVVIVLAAPVTEELLFRRVVFRSLQTGFGTAAALVVSSLAFALIHFNPSGFVLYAWIGAVCAITYDLTGRVLAPVLVHVLNNGLALGLLYGGFQ